MRLLSRCYVKYRHRRHVRNEQGEAPDTIFMALLHHPMAAEYRAIRQLYDRLPYACGRGQRYLSYRNRRNYTVLGRPELLMSADRVSRHSVSERSWWQHCIEHAAIAGWPKAYAPDIHPGALWIYTEDIEFTAAMQQMLSLGQDLSRPDKSHMLYIDQLSSPQYLDVLKVVAEFVGADLLTPLRPHLEEIAEQVQLMQKADAATYGYICPAPQAARQAPDRLQIDIDALNRSINRKDTWI